jgi:hypothetical protein
VSKRLFVRTTQSDGCWWYAGDAATAHRGLGNLLQEDIRQVLAGEQTIDQFHESFNLEVRDLTDAQVDALPDG